LLREQKDFQKPGTQGFNTCRNIGILEEEFHSDEDELDFGPSKWSDGKLSQQFGNFGGSGKL
jgi:hypothetical protein